MATHAGRNRLADSSSAYLRSAAEQPIDWHPWGPEPFELARRTGRPILLDIGASWCHWCHVMDEGTYSDAEVARLLGQHFVAVKVDRDLNPEVDRRYQRQVGALTGEGGWPLTAFLSPNGEVFLGGTYFPPTDGHGRPGFRRVLKEVARLWKEEPERIQQNSSAVRGALERMARRPSGGGGDRERLRAQVVSEVAASYDPVHGGFGMAPKFPHPTAVRLLLLDARLEQRSSSADRARDTLLRMADGGMYDQVGGGFHRYSVDEGWHVPHFEKMGMDNAELLDAYVDGAQWFREPRFEEVARGIVGWARSVLADPAGGFGANQDADNAPGDDGSYFTWSRAEMKAALDGEDLRFALRFFGVGTDGRMPHDPERSVLYRMLSPTEAAEGLSLRGSPEAALTRVVRGLSEARGDRPRPAVDPALYADINGRFIGAFTRAALVLEDDSLLGDARHAADRFLAEGYEPDRGIAHRVGSGAARGHGLLEDQVAFAAGLLELAGATAEPGYAEPARRLLELVDSEFRGEDGLLRDISPRLYDGPSMESLSEPSYPLEDNPHLAANSAAAIAFQRLASLVHDLSWRDRAERLLGAMSARIGHAGLFAGGAAYAAGMLRVDGASVVVEGRGESARSLLREALRIWHPNAWVFAAAPPPPFSLPGLPPPQPSGTPRALVCRGTSCAPPVTDPAGLRPLLEERTVRLS